MTTTITKLLTIPEFADAIGVSDSLARALVVGGSVPFVWVRNRRRVDYREIEKWLSRANPVIDRPAPSDSESR